MKHLSLVAYIVVIALLVGCGSSYTSTTVHRLTNTTPSPSTIPSPPPAPSFLSDEELREVQDRMLENCSPLPTLIPQTVYLTPQRPEPVPAYPAVPTPKQFPPNLYYCDESQPAIFRFTIDCYFEGPDWIEVGFSVLDSDGSWSDEEIDMYDSNVLDEVYLQYPGEILVWFPVNIDDFPGEYDEMVDYSLPDRSEEYCRIDLQDWAFEEYNDGNLHGEVDYNGWVELYSEETGNDLLEYSFSATITIEWVGYDY